MTAIDTAFAVSLLAHAIQAGTPLLLATVGEIYSERSGVLNLGLEGIMIMGALTAFLVSFRTGDVALAIVAAAIVGALMSLIHAFVSITLKANQIVSGLAISIFGLGVSGFLGRPLIGQIATKLQSTPIPLLQDIPVLGPILFSGDVLIYFSIIVSLVLWFVLFRTKLGLNIRSVGENPSMADSLGVNVDLTRYVCVLVGGVLGGLGGAYLSIVYTPLWIEGMTAGRGWIAIALTIFAVWNPLRAILGAYLFGGVIALQFRLQAIGIGTETPQLLLMLPYFVTIGTLILMSSATLKKRVGVPAALGNPYVRGE
jgi:simple sugar transport system permease protein